MVYDFGGMCDRRVRRRFERLDSARHDFNGAPAAKASAEPTAKPSPTPTSGLILLKRTRREFSRRYHTSTQQVSDTNALIAHMASSSMYKGIEASAGGISAMLAKGTPILCP
jgi:hypothetical protein